MSEGKKRSLTHIKGESGVNILKKYFPEEWVVREYTPDYGIDLSVELFVPFDTEFITAGEHVFFQVKPKIRTIVTQNLRFENTKPGQEQAVPFDGLCSPASSAYG